MEDELNGRHPQWKTAVKEDNLKGRGSQGRVSKTTSMEDTSMEDDLYGRQHQWKTTSIEDNFNGSLTGRRN